MVRLLLFIVAFFLTAFAFVWISERPGLVQISWLNLQIETSIQFFITALLALFVVGICFWSLLVFFVSLPNRLRKARAQRKIQQAYRLLCDSILALKGGEINVAKQLTKRASGKMRNEPLLELLRAEHAMQSGNVSLAKNIFQKMLNVKETKLAALHELYKIESRQGNFHQAQNLAFQAYELSPNVLWSAQAMLVGEAVRENWQGALAILEKSWKMKLYKQEIYVRKKAVLLTALAQQQEEKNWQQSLKNIKEAFALANNLVPAAILLAKFYVRQGKVRKAQKTLLACWDLSPHPDLASAYICLASSAVEQLKRAQNLALRGENFDSLFALAAAALRAKQWQKARIVLEKLIKQRQSEQVCLLMAELEKSQNNNKGKMQVWLGKAAKAARTTPDYAWVIEGQVSPKWRAVSPSGELDVCQWRLPVVIFSGAINGGKETMETMDMDIQEFEEPTTMEYARAAVGGVRPNRASIENVSLLNKATGMPSQRPDDPGTSEVKRKKKNLFFSFLFV